ncbi:hypothetical protein ABFS82_05G079600 [Erythranthe guttata]
MTTSKWCGEKGVLVAVYVERPKRRLPLLSLHEKDGIRRKGYNNNRRAELLDYARHLRSSASTKTSPSTSPILLPLLDEIPVADEKPKRSSTPNCLDKCKFLIPSFVRSTRVLKTTKEKEKKPVIKKVESAATTKIMKALVRKLQVMKKPTLMSQLLKKLQKRRQANSRIL